MKNYWGSNTLSGEIRQLNASTFEELSRNYFESGVPTQYSRVEYTAMTPDDKKKIKNGAYVTACSFNEGTTRRANENAKDVQLVILDIDSSEEAQFVIDNAENIKDQLGNYNFLVHTTVSHTEKNPRLRVLVSANACALDLRSSLTFYVANMLGLTTPTTDEDGNLTSVANGYDSCSTVTSQPFFRPITFRDDKTGNIIASRTNGVDIEESDIPEDEDLLDELEENFAYGGDLPFDDDDLENRRIPDLDMEWVEKALNTLDPDEADDSGNTYLPWFKICCALRHQFREEDEAMKAFEIFNDWSAKGAKYASREATYRKWRSFVPCPKGRRPSTIRSLFKRAIVAGWDYAPMAKQVQQTFEEWLESVDSPVVLSNEGVARIAAMPFKDDNEIIQNDLLTKLQKKLKALGISGATTTDLKKQLRKEKVKAAPKEDTNDRPPWLQPWCFLASGNVYFNTIDKSELIPASFNSQYSRELMHLIPEGSPNVNGKPPVLPTDYAMNVKQIPVAYGVTYDPSFGGDHTYLKMAGKTYVNRYQPPNMKPIEKDSKEAEGILRDFLSWAIRNEAHENHVIDMIAYAIQNPHKKVRTATIFQSVQGVGKSMFGDMLSAVFGEHNTSITNAMELKGDYNSFAKDAHCLILEELHAAGQNRKVVMDVLKEIITNDTIAVTEKYKNPTKVINKMLVFGFTNTFNSIAIDDNDRRFFCIRMKPTKEEQAARSKEGYFYQLARLSKKASKKDDKGFEGLAGGIVHFFNNYEVSESFDPNARAPETDYRSHLVNSAQPPMQADIEDLIADEAQPLIGRDVICMVTLKAALEDSSDTSRITHYLASMGYSLYVQGNTRRFSVNGVKTSIWYNVDTHEELLGSPIDIVRDRATEGDEDILEDLS
jgi:hypothetical protein